MSRGLGDVYKRQLCNHRLSELIAADGIHLTMPGYERLFDTLADWVKKNI